MPVFRVLKPKDNEDSIDFAKIAENLEASNKIDAGY